MATFFMKKAIWTCAIIASCTAQKLFIITNCWKSWPAPGPCTILWVLYERPRALRSPAPASRGDFFASADGTPSRSRAKGFVFRDYEPTIPPSVTYGITKRMRDISKVMGDLDELARKWQQEDARLPAKPESGKGRARHADVQEIAHP